MSVSTVVVSGGHAELQFVISSSLVSVYDVIFYLGPGPFPFFQMQDLGIPRKSRPISLVALG